MASFNIALGLGPEYLRVAIEPPIEDDTLIADLTGISGSHSTDVDGATVFYTNLPEGIFYNGILRDTIAMVQAHGHDVQVFDRLGEISASNNPFENERRNGVDIASVLVPAPIIEQLFR